MRIFDHTGWPDKQQGFELVSLVIVAVTITGIAVGGLTYSLEPFLTSGPQWLAFVASVICAALALYAWWLVGMGIRGKTSAKKVMPALVLAFALFSVSGYVGFIVGSIFG